jgi:hypothetical protein
MAAAPMMAASLASSEHGPDTQPSELPPLDLDIDLAAASKLTGLESTRPLSTTSGLPDLPAVQMPAGAEQLPEVPVTGMEPLPDLAELPPFEATPEDLPAHADEALPQPEVEPVSESKSMDFDFGDLSLDLGADRVAGQRSDEVPRLRRNRWTCRLRHPTARRCSTCCGRRGRLHRLDRLRPGR